VGIECRFGLQSDWLGALVSGALGFASLILGVKLGLAVVRLRLTGIRTVGTIVRNETVPGADGGVGYVMWIEYRLTSGEVLKFSDSVSNGVFHGPEGGLIPVIYDRNKPNEARVATRDHLWDIPLILVGVGGLVVIAVTKSFCG
jgi:hypothetical protein